MTEEVENAGRAAVICDGKVIDVIAVKLNDDGSTDFKYPWEEFGHDKPCDVVVLSDDSPVGPGWEYKGQQFAQPPAPEEPADETTTEA